MCLDICCGSYCRTMGSLGLRSSPCVTSVGVKIEDVSKHNTWDKTYHLFAGNVLLVPSKVDNRTLVSLPIMKHVT